MIYVKVASLVNILPALLKIVILTSPNIYSIATSRGGYVVYKHYLWRWIHSLQALFVEVDT